MYPDDIIVVGRAFDELLYNLGEILRRITMAGKKLSVKKRAFFQKQMKYLGHLVTVDVIFTEDKTRAVK